MRSKRFLVQALAVIFLIFVIGSFLHSRRFVRYQEPTYLTFSELQKLYKNPHPGGALKWKLAKYRATPIISNEAYYEGVKPAHRTDPRLGAYLTLASWNIGEEELFHLRDTITTFTSADQFRSLINLEKAPVGSPEYNNILRQRERLASADIIAFQEVNVGVKRSEYMDEVKELGKALKMNYTFGDEQLEIDPVLLGLEKIYYSDGKTVDQERTNYFLADSARYKGALGNAVFSRYPIKKVQVFQLKHIPYDWYAGEKEKSGFVESLRETGSDVVFDTEFTRDVRVGTQIFFRVDLDVPGLPEKTLTVINIHLEINCTPKEREIQTAEILSYMRGIKHPVIVAGDLNAASEDMSATSAKRIAVRTVQDPTAWLNVATDILLP